MLIVIIVLCILAWVQVVLAIHTTQVIPSVDSLGDSQRARATPWPMVSMIVPAKDEQDGIESALRSKLSCGYPRVQVIAVDDRSTDNTGALIEKLVHELPGLTHARVDVLPEGWLGKMNALQTGIAKATGEWVLFSDADVHIAPGTLETLISHADEQRIDFVAVFPQMLPVSLSVDAAIGGLLRSLTMGSQLWKTNSDESTRGGGVGAFSLARTSWLQKTRAIEELRMEIADDVALGALLKQRGARTRFYAGRTKVNLTFQKSLRTVLASAEKGGGMFRWKLWLPLVVAVVPVFLELLLPSWALRLGGPMAVLATATLAGTTLTHLLLVRHFRAPTRGAFLWPIAHLLNAYAIIYSGFLAWKRQGIVWRNTFYSRAVVDAGRRLDLRTLRVKSEHAATNKIK